MRKMFRAHVTVSDPTWGDDYRPEIQDTYTIPVFFRDREAAMQAAIKSASRYMARWGNEHIDMFGRRVPGGVECKVSVTSERVVVV